MAWSEFFFYSCRVCRIAKIPTQNPLSFWLLQVRVWSNHYCERVGGRILVSEEVQKERLRFDL
jgi:hypothetical protein